MKTILELDYKQAKYFLLKQESYVTLELPSYIKFENLIAELSKLLDDKKDINNLKKVSNKKRLEPKEIEGVNYRILHNKNGKYDYRQLELIHPLLYANLVNTITKKENWEIILNYFEENKSKSSIECMSLPVLSEEKATDKEKQILKWFEEIGQRSLKLSLDFSYLYHTDITNCYGSIYTHSIPWALHTKPIAKKRKKKLLGDMIDMQIQAMSYGQTNGIPQGSVLMDFIAEIVLSYADVQLSEILNGYDIDVDEYKILRYRDDYRIFTNNLELAELIIKTLSEVLIELGMKLNSNKTIFSDNVIQSSLKPDKLRWIAQKNSKISLQRKLLLLHNYSLENKNNSILNEELKNIYREIHKKTSLNIKKILKKIIFKNTETKITFQDAENYRKKITIPLLKKREKFKEKENILVLLSIIVDIAYINSKVYPECSAIISKLFAFINDEEKEEFILKMNKKFSKIPNTGYMQIWIQRIIKNTEIAIDFDEPICKIVNETQNNLWNNSWLKDSVKNIFNKQSIIDKDAKNKLSNTMSWSEVGIFTNFSL